MKRRIYRISQSASSALGILLLFGAVSTSDFYTLELKQAEPGSVNLLILWGLILLAPSALHMLREWLKERVK